MPESWGASVSLLGEENGRSPLTVLGTALRGRIDRSEGSRVLRGMSIEGALNCDAPLAIDGEVWGEVSCAALHVGEHGHIMGNVAVARHAIIDGHIEGHVRAGHVHLRAHACVIGSIAAASLIIERGAYFETAATVDGFASLEINGHIKANVRCAQLLIGGGGAVEGNIVADRIVIDGVVRGTVHGADVQLRSGANVHGDIHHRTLGFEQGAVFEGKARRIADRPRA